MFTYHTLFIVFDNGVTKMLTIFLDYVLDKLCHIKYWPMEI